MTYPQRRAIAALLRKVAPEADELGSRFAAHGHELALVGGCVRDVFLARPCGDLDLTTDAAPERVMEIANGWADNVWQVGIEFGTVGLRKGSRKLEITTYRSEKSGFFCGARGSRGDGCDDRADRYRVRRADPGRACQAHGRRGSADRGRTARGHRAAEHILPEVPKLKLETDEHHRHKDVYQHSLTVLSQASQLEGRYGLSGDLVLRLAALLHDIGKPRTRTLLPDGRVAFHHHEVVGAAMVRSRLRELHFPRAVVSDTARLVELHLRFHGYGTGEWTDAAVRRYVRDAGPLLTRLHVLTRADCTTRNKARAARLASAYDALEQRIARLAAEEEIGRIRPDLDGNEIMRILGVPAGPVVGEAYRFLLGLRMEHGPLGHERAKSELRGWARERGLQIPD